MKARHVILTVGLVIAAWLAFFGDKTPSATIAEPAERTKAATNKILPSTKSQSDKANQSAQLDKTRFDARLSTDSQRVSAPVGNVVNEKKSDKKAAVVPVISALIDRQTLIGSQASEKKKDSLFGNQNWTPPPPPAPKMVALPPPAPVAPPLPFTYLGKKIEGGIWEVYLARGEQTFIVRADAVIEANYRVNDIKPPVLTLTYLPLNQVQTLTIGGTD